MHVIIAFSENSDTPEPGRCLSNLSGKIGFSRPKILIYLSNLRVGYTQKKTQEVYNNNKFKISATTWHEEFEFCH